MSLVFCSILVSILFLNSSSANTLNPKYFITLKFPVKSGHVNLPTGCTTSMFVSHSTVYGSVPSLKIFIWLRLMVRELELNNFFPEVTLPYNIALGIGNSGFIFIYF